GGRRTLRVTGDRSTHAAVGGPGRGLDVGEVRPAELAHLEARARACFETRTPVFVDVRGPAGAGKSRLREAVMAHVAERREVDWLVARAAPLGEAAPLSLLRAADPAWLDAALRPGLTDRAATLAAARRWIEGRARRRPVVIVVEDLQWADEMSRAVLGHLVSHLDAVPVLVLGFTRDEPAPRAGDAAAPAAPPAPAGVEVVTLGPLDDATALRLARAAAPAASDDDLADVVARAGGNPFFVEELARDLAERGAGGATSVAAALPATVEAVLQARLDRLSPAAGEVLAAAAVVGRTFWREAVREAMATPPDDVALDQALAELERRGLVRPALPALVDDDRYEVPQALVRDVAYGRLTARERRRAHGQVARWLERRTGGLRAQDPDVLFALAHHRDAGDDPGAALAWRAAAQRSIELFAFRQALAAARRAWDLAEAAGGADAALAELVGDAATEADTVEVAEARYQRALELTPDDGEHAIARARLWHKLGLAASSRADHARAIERYQRGLALVEPGGELTAEARRDPRLAAALSGSLGWVLAYQLSSPDPRGLALCERACRLLEGTPHRRELAWALSRLGGAYMRAGRLADQLRCNQQNLAIAIELGDLGNQLTARINLGVVLANLDQLDDAVTHTEEALRLCRRTGARVAEGLVLSNLAGYLLDRGELDAAARRLDEAIPLLERTGSRRVLPESYTFVARLAARRGDLAAAAAAAQTSAELAREQGIPFDVGLAMRILAQVE
ncbi:MAG: AAA family ATPase, partial [Kofleriaceae bacterium]|nr:AAA family ATPase [Kofleriaceae bacterium]